MALVAVVTRVFLVTLRGHSAEFTEVLTDALRRGR